MQVNNLSSADCQVSHPIDMDALPTLSKSEDESITISHSLEEASPCTTDLTGIEQDSATDLNSVHNTKITSLISLEDGTVTLQEGSTGGQMVKLVNGTLALVTVTDPRLLPQLKDNLNVVSWKDEGTSIVNLRKRPGIKQYPCEFTGCDRMFTTVHHLKVHERQHTGCKPYKCEFASCLKRFSTGYGLKAHTRTHTGEKPYRCPEESCIKAFKTSGDLQKHVRTHTGERPFPCPVKGCDKSFTTSNIRKVHLRVHTGERPYICNFTNCNKTFTSATNHRNHLRIHTGERPYACTVSGCTKRFTEYSSLYKHQIVHTQNRPYSCSTCGKTYRQTSTLAMHRRTAHGELGVVTDDNFALQFAESAEDEDCDKDQIFHISSGTSITVLPLNDVVTAGTIMTLPTDDSETIDLTESQM